MLAGRAGELRFELASSGPTNAASATHETWPQAGGSADTEPPVSVLPRRDEVVRDEPALRP